MTLNKIIYFLRLSIAELFWNKAMYMASLKKTDESLYYLNKSYRFSGVVRSYSNILLESHLNLMKRNYMKMFGTF